MRQTDAAKGARGLLQSFVSACDDTPAGPSADASAVTHGAHARLHGPQPDHSGAALVPAERSCHAPLS